MTRDEQRWMDRRELLREAGFDPVVVGNLAQTRRFDLGQPLANGNMTAAETRKALGR